MRTTREDNLKIAATIALAVGLNGGMLNQYVARRALERDEERKSRYQARKFNWNSYDDKSSIREFNFSKSEIEELVDILGIRGIKYPGRLNPGPILAFCLTLDRLSYPGKYTYFYSKYRYSSSAQGIIFTTIIRHLYKNYGRIVQWNENILSTEKIEQYSTDLYTYSDGAIRNVWGFIGITSRRISRPTDDQGHKNYHCLKFQEFVTPDGIISIYGPEKSNVPDLRIFATSEILNLMIWQLPHDLDKEFYPFNLYGDSVYGTGRGTIGPNNAPRNLEAAPQDQELLNNRQERMNAYISSQNITSEWIFSQIPTYFAYADMKRLPKVTYTMAVEIHIVSAFLINLISCYRGNRISRKFKVTPPTVREYLGLVAK